MKNKKEIIAMPNERIISRIFLIRGKKVMVDRDLANLYGAETRSLNQAVRRNIDRFPVDFMFQLNQEETNIWKSQIVISVADKKGLRKSPLVFTEQLREIFEAIKYLLMEETKTKEPIGFSI